MKTASDVAFLPDLRLFGDRLSAKQRRACERRLAFVGLRSRSDALRRADAASDHGRLQVGALNTAVSLALSFCVAWKGDAAAEARG